MCSVVFIDIERMKVACNCMAVEKGGWRWYFITSNIIGRRPG